MHKIFKLLFFYSLFCIQVTVATDPFESKNFPDNLIYEVLSYINSPKDIACCQAVSKRFQLIIKDYRLISKILNAYFDLSKHPTHIESVNHLQTRGLLPTKLQYLYYDQFINIDYAQIIPSIKDQLMIDSNDISAFLLLQAYENLRQNSNNTKLNHTEFRKRVKDLYRYIHYNLDQYAITDQHSLQNVISTIIKSLPFNCDALSGVLNPLIKSKLEDRLSLSKIDQQLFEKRALRGHILKFNPLNETANRDSTEVGYALDQVMGRIFQILVDENDDEFVLSIASAMMTKLIDGKPVTVKDGDLLNGIITSAHVIAALPFQRIEEIYFVPHSKLDSETGLPKSKPMQTGEDLIGFLTTNESSYLVKRYTNVKRIIVEEPGKDIEKTVLLKGNSSKASNPQYRSYEDIVFCLFENSKTYEYLSPVRIEYPKVSDQESHLGPFNSKKHFAIGYPVCFHYDLDLLEDHEHYKLIKRSDFLLAPLIITEGEGPLNIKDGCLVHKSNSAKGASGGAIIEIESKNEFVTTTVDDATNNNLITIRTRLTRTSVIKYRGCISSINDDNEETCCYYRL